jgi:hypothetical protein
MRLKDCIAVVGGARLLVKLFPRSKQALERACYYHTASFAALTVRIPTIATTHSDRSRPARRGC